jgi:hypothetical protein
VHQLKLITRPPLPFLLRRTSPPLQSLSLTQITAAVLLCPARAAAPSLLLFKITTTELSSHPVNHHLTTGQRKEKEGDKWPQAEQERKKKKKERKEGDRSKVKIDLRCKYQKNGCKEEKEKKEWALTH